MATAGRWRPSRGGARLLICRRAVGAPGDSNGNLRLSRATRRHQPNVPVGSIDPFARPSPNGRYVSIPVEDPRRFGSDSGHLVADPIGHQVRFSPLGVPESLKSSEHRFLLFVRHLIDHAHIGAYSVLGLPQPRSRIATAAAIFAFHWAARGQAGDGCPAGSRGCSMERKSCLASKRCRQCVQWIGSAAGY